MSNGAINGGGVNGEDKENVSASPCVDVKEGGEGETDGVGMSKKALKKAEKQAAKDAKKSSNPQQQQQQLADDILTETFGQLDPIKSTLRPRRQWVAVKEMSKKYLNEKNSPDSSASSSPMWTRARLHNSRKTSNKLGFIVLRDREFTIQAVIAADDDKIPRDMVKWTLGIPLESVVEVFGTLTEAPETIKSTTQQDVEFRVEKIFCSSRATPQLPMMIEDASRTEAEYEKDPSLVRVNQDVRLDYRVIDLRTRANQAIFRISSLVCTLFREFLLSQDFVEIHTPKLLAGASEGGASCFTFKYFNMDGCLAQSPQLYKQMVLCGDMDRVFEIAPVFRAENANTYRHLCEFTGLDMEMTFKDTYEEVLDVLQAMFCFIFRGIVERAPKEIEAVQAQYPADPFVVSEEIPRLHFKDGIEMLRQAGEEVPEDISDFDLSTPLEKALGKIVKKKYNTDFYMLIRYPTGARPFYSMPCQDDPTFSNSYDFFMRGEEIVSGAQRVHDPDLLTQRAEKCGIPVKSIQSYIDAFKFGAFPHAGCGVGLERVVMLFLGLGNVRKTSLFPRDPKRLTP